MITYRTMDATCSLPTCLHGGPILVGGCHDSATRAAYVETVSDIAPGSVAAMLHDISGRYGGCGVVAVEDDLVVGKIRTYPQAIVDRVPYPCVQRAETVRPLLGLSMGELPTREEFPVLHIYCIQRHQAGTARGSGCATGRLSRRRGSETVGTLCASVR